MIQPCYYKGERGNKPYPLETMLRLYLLQNLYDLSDEATVAEAIDSRAFSEFCYDDTVKETLRIVTGFSLVFRKRICYTETGGKRENAAA